MISQIQSKRGKDKIIVQVKARSGDGVILCATSAEVTPSFILSPAVHGTVLHREMIG